MSESAFRQRHSVWPRAQLGRFFRLLSGDWVALASFVYLTGLVFVAVFADALRPHDPNEQDLLLRLLPPAWSGGNGAHLLGTDALGRDVTSLLLSGTRLSLLIPLVSVAIAGSLGTCLGLVAGFYGGKADAIIMRVVDSMMAFSSLLVVIVFTSLLGGGEKTLVGVFGLTGWVLFTRTVRGLTLPLRSAPFVLAARCAGCSDLRLMLKHVLPSSIPMIVSLAVIDVGRYMIAEAGLSFLGFGVQPPQITWGLMLSQGRAYLSVAIGLIAVPGLAITLTVLALTLFGSWVRSVTDPFRSRHATPLPIAIVGTLEIPVAEQ